MARSVLSDLGFCPLQRAQTAAARAEGGENNLDSQ
jgi:hypothetical protein